MRTLDHAPAICRKGLLELSHYLVIVRIACVCSDIFEGTGGKKKDSEVKTQILIFINTNF